MTAADTAVRTLLAVGVVLLACNVVGWLVARIGQPRVVGELLAGIVLGPSALGLALPGVGAYLFPEPVIGALRVVAQLGLVLFLLLVGLEAAPGAHRLGASRVGAVASASVVVPLLLAAALAVGLHPAYGEGAPLTAFVLFFGAAVSVTALPVLARLLRETGLAGSRIGATALVAAAGNDVVAWVPVAVAATLVEARGVGSFLMTAGGAVVIVLVLVLGVRPLLARWGTPPLWVPVVVALVSAWAAEQVGIHAIFGAFLAGLSMPRSEVWRTRLRDRLDPAVSTILLPVFFVVVGLSTRVDRLTALDGLVFLAVLVVAVVGKVGGVALTARLLGDEPRDALTLGVLMNARGVTEIVVLTVGLELGLIGPTVFTVLVLVAVVTTFMTAPLLRAIRGAGRPQPSVPATARPRSTRPGAADPAGGDHVVVAPDRSARAVRRDDVRGQAGVGGRAGAQGAVRRTGPAPGEHLAVHGVRRSGGGEPRLILRVHVGLPGQEEPRAHPGRLGPESQHGGHPAGIGDATGGQDRDAVEGVDHRRHQGHRGDAAEDVSTRLPALRDHRVGTDGRGAHGVLDRADHVDVQQACVADRRRGLRRIAP